MLRSHQWIEGVPGVKIWPQKASGVIQQHLYQWVIKTPVSSGWIIPKVCFLMLQIAPKNGKKNCILAASWVNPQFKEQSVEQWQSTMHVGATTYCKSDHIWMLGNIYETLRVTQCHIYIYYICYTYIYIYQIVRNNVCLT